MKDGSLKYISDIAFTPSVKEFQEKHNSRRSYERMEQYGGWNSEINSELTQFISSMDSFYLGTTNSNGQPYIQHRGGPKGFLKVLDNSRLAFADFSGNKQFISVGNLSENNKAFIFLMDYTNQTRIKIWGTAVVEYDDKDLINALSDDSYKAKSERAIIFTAKAWDINCRQHIKQRFTADDIEKITNPLHKRIKELENLLQKGD